MMKEGNAVASCQTLSTHQSQNKLSSREFHTQQQATTRKKKEQCMPHGNGWPSSSDAIRESNNSKHDAIKKINPIDKRKAGTMSQPTPKRHRQIIRTTAPIETIPLGL
eukprot:scaffold10917_cov155-Amphora_coffeaeformis.AAC.3